MSMDTEHKRRAEEMLAHTLAAVASRRRVRNSRRVLGGGTLLLLGAAWLLVLGTKVPDEGRVVFAPLPGISLIRTGSEPAAVPLNWAEPRALLLVMDGAGVEMKAMSEGQIAALARKPGCEFEMGPEAFLIVSDPSDLSEPFPFGEAF
jgi:hypothetical protein